MVSSDRQDLILWSSLSWGMEVKKVKGLIKKIKDTDTIMMITRGKAGAGRGMERGGRE